MSARADVLPYNPADWYWSIAGDATHVFSSRRNTAVVLADADYLAWLAQPGAIVTRIDSLANLKAVLTAAGVPPYLPVTPLQARRALRAAGLLDAVTTAVAGADADTQDAWNHAISISRTDPIIATLGAALGLSDAQIDALFIAAASLT